MSNEANAPTPRNPKPAAFVLGVIAVVLGACGSEQPTDNSLPALGASGRVTVSGISSGGYMAGQYFVAHSASVDGAAIVAAGPWACARGDIGRALQTCIDGDGLELAELHELAAEKSASGRIDSTDNLSEKRALVFHGANDAVVSRAVVDALGDWLATYLDDGDILVVDDVPATHGWPTLDQGAPCDTFAAPYINNCGYDLAGEIFAHLHGELAAPSTSARPLRRFEQRPFGDAGLAENGYVYVPSKCESVAGCSVHVFFHGCEQSANTIGTELAAKSGFNRWADSNDIIVLYPQVEKSLAAPMNPLGCWDWWGYTGADYLDRDGAQLQAIRNMVATLAGEP